MPAEDAAKPESRLHLLGRRHALGMIVFAVLLYSTGPVLVVAADMGGVAFSFWRLWVAVPLVVGATIVHVRLGGAFPRGRGLRWLVYAGVAFAVNQLLFMTAVKMTTVNDYVVMNTLQPLAVAVLAYRIFDERPGPGFRLWTVVAMLGIGVVFYGASAGPSGEPLGMTLAAGSVVAFAVFFMVSKRARTEVDVIPFIFGFIVFAAIVVTIFALAIGEPLGQPSRGDLVLAVVVAAGPGGIGHFIMTWPLRWVPANVPPVIRLAQPILSGLLAWAWLGQPIAGRHVLGGLLTIVGVLGALLTPSGRRFARSELTEAPGVGEGRESPGLSDPTRPPAPETP